ncbi:MAG: hypothetical protein ABH879_08225 [archaeon]
MIGNKKGLELSINFLVVLILTIVVLGFGIFFVRKLMGGAEEIRTSLDDQTMARIEALLNDGSRVAIPFVKKETSPGKPAIFGVGILNVVGDDRFRTEAKFSAAYRDDKSKICKSGSTGGCGSDPDGWILMDKSEKLIINNENAKYVVAITPPGGTPKGTYIFDIKVKYWNDGLALPGWDDYSSMNKVFVKV